MAVGKGLAAGYLPMSATVASRRVADAFLGEDLGPATFYHGHSFGGNALAAAVARRHLALLREWDVLANVAARSEQLAPPSGRDGVHRRRWRKCAPAGSWPGSSWLLPRLGCDGAARCARRRWRPGCSLRPLGDVVVVMPILTSTAAEIDRIADVLEAAIGAVCR